MSIKPTLFQWDGEALYPASPMMARICDQQFVIGERYMMIDHHDRSMNSHRHYFACIHDAWQNLPEAYAGMPFAQSSEHLRAYALIRTGYCESHTVVCSSKAEAQRMAAFIRPIDQFSVVDVKEATVTRFTAKSQSMKAMDRKEFQRSKDDVLTFLEDLIGLGKGDLMANQRAAA